MGRRVLLQGLHVVSLVLYLNTRRVPVPRRTTGGGPERRAGTASQENQGQQAHNYRSDPPAAETMLRVATLLSPVPRPSGCYGVESCESTDTGRGTGVVGESARFRVQRQLLAG